VSNITVVCYRQEKEADDIQLVAARAVNTSTSAYELARGAMNQQQNIRYCERVVIALFGNCLIYRRSQDNVVGIATHYGLDGPGIESQWGPEFLYLSRLAVSPAQLPIQWILGLSLGYSGWRMVLTTHPHRAPRLKKEYSCASGTLWPVPGRNLPLLLPYLSEC
jgi:hypothetical protein